jgi:hypothetical protein
LCHGRQPYPGAFRSVAEPVGWFAASVPGALCLGALVDVVMTSRPEPDRLIDADFFQIHLVAERVSIVWLAFAGAMVPVQATNDVGVTLPELLSSAAYSTLLPRRRPRAAGSSA